VRGTHVPAACGSARRACRRVAHARLFAAHPGATAVDQQGPAARRVRRCRPCAPSDSRWPTHPWPARTSGAPTEAGKARACTLGARPRGHPLDRRRYRRRSVPAIELLAEAPARAGFFEDHQYDAVVRHLLEDLQAALAIARTYGWRMRSEVFPPERRQLDLRAGTLRRREILAGRVRRRWCARAYSARLPTHGRAQPRARWRAALGGHKDRRPQDGGGVLALRDRERLGPSGGRAEAGGHIVGTISVSDVAPSSEVRRISAESR